MKDLEGGRTVRAEFAGGEEERADREEVYRIGGRYDPQLREIVSHLEAAIPFATEPMAKALRALIKWYRDRRGGDRLAYDIAWVQDKDSPVDTINGFTEVYLDARGVKGAWEALVYYVNRRRHPRSGRSPPTHNGSKTGCRGIRSIASRACNGITANAIDIVIETGDSGPVTPIGINLPNDQDVREKYGSKSVSLSNINEAYDGAMDPGFRTEFSWTPEEAARAREVAARSSASSPPISTR